MNPPPKILAPSSTRFVIPGFALRIKIGWMALPFDDWCRFKKHFEWDGNRLGSCKLIKIVPVTTNEISWCTSRNTFVCFQSPTNIRKRRSVSFRCRKCSHLVTASRVKDNRSSSPSWWKELRKSFQGDNDVASSPCILPWMNAEWASRPDDDSSLPSWLLWWWKRGQVICSTHTIQLWLQAGSSMISNFVTDATKVVVLVTLGTWDTMTVWKWVKKLWPEGSGGGGGRPHRKLTFGLFFTGRKSSGTHCCHGHNHCGRTTELTEAWWREKGFSLEETLPQ